VNRPYGMGSRPNPVGACHPLSRSLTAGMRRVGASWYANWKNSTGSATHTGVVLLPRMAMCASEAAYCHEFAFAGTNTARRREACTGRGMAASRGT